MLPFSPDPSVFQTAKCYFTHGTMGRIDPAQPPTIAAATTRTTTTTTASGTGRLRKPWSAIQALGFVSQVDLVLPHACVDAVRRRLDGGADAGAVAPFPRRPPQYARVVMTLGQVLEGSFYQVYVQAGNVLLLSEGRPGQDNTFALRDGQLTLFLERETYERAGLVGKPHGAKGGRGLRPRWVVEVDLRARAMRPGKPGFERLLYACKNVLDRPRTWLFCNLADTPSPDPLAAFAPTVVAAVEPTVTHHPSTAMPPLGRPSSLLAAAADSDSGPGDSRDREAAAQRRLEADEAVVELYEWLALVRLGSPRVRAADTIDPYLSRYQVPGAGQATATPATGSVSTLRWRGFFSPTWACQLLVDVLAALPSAPASSSAWCALAVSGFARSRGLAGDSPECVFFRPADAPREFLLWDVHSHE